MEFKDQSSVGVSIPFTSRYAKCQVGVEDHELFLMPAPEIKIRKDVSDQIYTVTSAEEGRLDKISWEMYGTKDFWWVIAQLNGIINPWEVPAGTQLSIPTQERIYREVINLQ